MQAPAIRVARHESPEASWEMMDRPPRADLRPWVRGYTGWWERTAAALRRREVPAGEVTLILNLGPELRVRDPAGRVSALSSFVAGLDDSFSVVEHDGVSHGVEVQLTPPGAYRLLGVPMHELSRLVVSLEDLLGAGPARRMLERLHDAGGWPERLALVDALLARRLTAGPEPSPDLLWAWQRLEATAGGVPVGLLAQEIGCSRRHLSSRFREQVGLSPKTFARVLRFERVVAALRADPARGWAELALECGYYDQPHLNRDFRELAGTTPSAYVAGLLPAGAGSAA